MRVLELFSGTHSVGNVCKKLGFEVVSVDISDYGGKHPPTHKVDILEWDYKSAYPKGHFNIVWGSPPCIWYSSVQNCWVGREKVNPQTKEKYMYTKELLEHDRLYADSLVKKTFEIIEYFNPDKWYVENPQTGILKTRDFMKDIPYYDADYCKYSDWGYRKRTRFWTNVKGLELRLCNKDCENMQEVNGRLIHKRSIGGHKSYQKSVGGGNYRLDKYRIPCDLIKQLFGK